MAAFGSQGGVVFAQGHRRVDASVLDAVRGVAGQLESEEASLSRLTHLRGTTLFCGNNSGIKMKCDLASFRGSLCHDTRTHDVAMSP